METPDREDDEPPESERPTRDPDEPAKPDVPGRATPPPKRDPSYPPGTRPADPIDPKRRP
jgi:hypothetical protein